MLKRKGLWDRIDEVLWAVEGEDQSPGARVAAQHGVKLAPFFVVRDEEGAETVVTSALRLVRQYLESAPAREAPAAATPVDLAAAETELAEASPQEILRFGLETWGKRCAIAFSGGEDVALVDMASSLDLPFSVFVLDTGRLHDETYQFLDDVRLRYGIEIETQLPDQAEASDLMSRKGPNSFYRDGHWECCSIRKLRPLGRVLSRFDAWVTGQRREGRPIGELPVVQADPSFRGRSDGFARLNPLAGWSRIEVFDYLRRQGVPTNPLHRLGFARIGCAPCTRARTGSPGEPDRWWWEEQPPGPSAPDPGSGI
ncbi:MAG: phosphoadenylyl-sulfate reductase [Deltaproteobacteria bacterium]|nr:phosphoadenylyl-sulfate reductase [Deltaproteobacteria bacterium]